MTIYFENQIQKALYKHELLGQISDGMWENSRPWDHWKSPCNAEVKIDAENPRRVGRRTRKYNFTDGQLLEWVGDRMIILANMAENGFRGRALSLADHSWKTPEEMTVTINLAMSLDEIQEKMAENYWVKKQEEIISLFGSREAYEAAKVGSYDLKKLRKELLAMKKVMNAE